VCPRTKGISRRPMGVGGYALGDLLKT